MHIKVVTPVGVYMDQNVSSIHLKTVMGEMTILPHHTPLFAALVPCPLILKDENGQEKQYALSGGFLKFENDDMVILTDAIEGKEEIDVERAQRALKRAQDRIEKKDEVTNMKRANLALARAITRIHVSEWK